MSMSIDDIFVSVGVTSARDKTLALVNSPELFYDLWWKKYGEDYVMCELVLPHVGRLLTDEVFPDEHATNKHTLTLKYSPVKSHIYNSIFCYSKKEDRRNYVYSLRDPSYLDAIIKSLIDMRDRWNVMMDGIDKTIKDFCEAETNSPLFYFTRDYEKHFNGN